jgi:hypothetical protein
MRDWPGETAKPITNINAGGCAPGLAALTRRPLQVGPYGFEASDWRSSFGLGRAYLGMLPVLSWRWVVIRDGQNTKRKRCPLTIGLTARHTEQKAEV